MECLGPSSFLRSLYDLDPALATNKLHEQAETIRIPYHDLLIRLRPLVPGFVDYICEEQSIDLPASKAISN